MAQQELDFSQVSPLFQKLGGKEMSQAMGVESIQAGRPGQAGDDSINAVPIQSVKHLLLCCLAGALLTQGNYDPFRHGDNSLSSAFAQPDQDTLPVKVQVRD